MSRPAGKRPATAGPRPWVAVGGSGVLTGLGHGFVGFAISSLVKPLAQDLDLGRGSVSSAIGAGRLVSGLTAPLAGYLADRIGPLRSVLIGLVLSALGFALLTRVTSLAGLALTWGVLVSAGASFAFTVALDKLVVQSLVTHRGLALAIRLSVAGLVTTALIPVVARAIELFGWRVVCQFWSLLMLGLLPVVWALFRGRPNTAGALPPDAEAGRTAALAEPWWTLFVQPVYWVIAVGFMALAGTNIGLTVHLVPLVTDIGYSQALAATVLGSLVLLSVPVRLLVGALADRASLALLFASFAGVMLLEGAALAWLALAPATPALAATLVTLSLSTGATTLIVLVLVSRLYGVERFGFVQGSLMLFQVPGTALAPIILGYAHDATHSYALALAGFSVVLLLTGLVVLLTGFVQRDRP